MMIKDRVVAREFRRIYFKYPNLKPETQNIIEELRVGVAIELEKLDPRFSHYTFNKMCGK